MSSLSSLKVYALTNFPHFLHPNTALILTDQDDEETYTPALGIRTTYPLQLATNLNSIVEENIVLRLVEQKNKYLHDVEKFTGNYCRSSKIISMLKFYLSHFKFTKINSSLLQKPIRLRLKRKKRMFIAYI